MGIKPTERCGVEFLRIGDSKLKILLDDGEMKKYKLESVYADACDSGFRRSFWKILERAKEECGFDPEGDKVLIQFYPIGGGGCEVFVTKLGLLSDASARMVSRSDKVTMLSKKRSVYSFERLEDVVSVCRIISGKGLADNLSADVYHNDGRYYLAIDEYGRGGEAMEFPFIVEFGSAVSRELSTYVFEHAEPVIKRDAVKRLSEL